MKLRFTRRSKLLLSLAFLLLFLFFLFQGIKGQDLVFGPRSSPFTLITFYSDTDSIPYNNFIKGVRSLGYRAKILYLEPAEEVEFWKNRFDRMYKYVKHQRPNALVLFSDCFDVVLSAPPKEMYRRYQENYEGKVVFSAECLCDTFPCRYDPTLQADMEARSPGPFRFLNAGSFMGRAKDLVSLFKFASQYPAPDDQSRFARVYVNHPRLVTLDTPSLLFGVIPPTPELLDMHWRLGPSDALPSATTTGPQDAALWRDLHRTGTPTAPALFHFPGMRLSQKLNPCQALLTQTMNAVGQATHPGSFAAFPVVLDEEYPLADHYTSVQSPCTHGAFARHLDSVSTRCLHFMYFFSSEFPKEFQLGGDTVALADNCQLCRKGPSGKAQCIGSVGEPPCFLAFCPDGNLNVFQGTSPMDNHGLISLLGSFKGQKEVCMEELF